MVFSVIDCLTRPLWSPLTSSVSLSSQEMGQLNFISKRTSRSYVCCKRSRLKSFFQKKQVQPGWHSDGHPLMWTAWPPWGLATSPTPLSSRWVGHSTFFQFDLFVDDLLTIHSPGPGASFREVWRCWRHLLANWKGHWQVWTIVLNRFELHFSYFQVSRLCFCSVLR